VSGSAAELLRRVDQALTDYARADQVTRTVENLTSLEKQLSPHVEDLGQAVAALDALDRVNQSVERPDTRAAITACRKTAEFVRQNRSAPQDLPRTLRLITDAVKTANTTALEAWQESINARVPGLDSLNKLADTLSQLGAAKPQVANLRTAVSDLQRLSRQLPGKSAPTQAAKAAEDIRAALQVLLGSGTDNDEVRHFVEAVARGGAHVRDLTPDVMQWMRNSQIEISFKIIAGKPASE
jgi:hypothetical protein